MECESCGYENPRQTAVCIECGAGLGTRAKRRAESLFRQQLGIARTRAEERLRRELVRR